MIITHPFNLQSILDSIKEDEHRITITYIDGTELTGYLTDEYRIFEEDDGLDCIVDLDKIIKLDVQYKR